jgi:hypothetical protein
MWSSWREYVQRDDVVVLGSTGDPKEEKGCI